MFLRKKWRVHRAKPVQHQKNQERNIRRPLRVVSSLVDFSAAGVNDGGRRLVRQRKRHQRLVRGISPASARQINHAAQNLMNVIGNEAIRAAIVAVEELILALHVTREVEKRIPRRALHCESEGAGEFFETLDEGNLPRGLDRAVATATNQLNCGFRREMLAHDEVTCDHQSCSSKPRVAVDENSAEFFDVRVHALDRSEHDVVLRRGHIRPRKFVVGDSVSHQISLSVVRVARVGEDSVGSAKRVLAFFLEIEDAGDFVFVELLDVVEFGEEASRWTLRSDDEVSHPVRVETDDGGFLRGLIFVRGGQGFVEGVVLLFCVVFVLAGHAAAGDAAVQILTRTIEKGFNDCFVEMAPFFLVDDAVVLLLWW